MGTEKKRSETFVLEKSQFNFTHVQIVVFKLYHAFLEAYHNGSTSSKYNSYAPGTNTHKRARSHARTHTHMHTCTHTYNTRTCSVIINMEAFAKSAALLGGDSFLRKKWSGKKEGVWG
ncbi:hypothetical protein POVWA1_026570 [Plasmodium ovale wallikeri]|uniref:Uncharacterized protein n=1 Tax=Plasmodium ovale wallikeri TaxID=864142 RepID=A0A1A8YV18_PLAOA|nr:hypothetical protein POVWA1_026570 [Plasmodium ovale wallikeri]